MRTKDILMLSMVKGIGPATIKKNLQRLMTEDSCYNLVEELKPEEMEYLPVYEKDAESIISICKIEGIEIIDITSLSYPPLLLEISNPPAIIYVKGNKKLLEKVIAIIGTRNSTDIGNRIAERLGDYFSRDFAICNGLVEGIDEHSIYVNGKIIPNVVGIISGGLCFKSTCSQNHIRVIEDVLASGGLIISEFPPMKKEDQYAGGNSSRIQAGLSLGIILVQSKIDGGSKYTLEKFVKLERVLGVVDFSANSEYQDDVFEANRLILKDKEYGLAKFVGLKTVKTLKIKDIVSIKGKDDYRVFRDKLRLNDSVKLKLF